MQTHTIQYPDHNVGPGSYRHLSPDQLAITSIWYTIQGEGPFAGYPAVFVRLAGCNRGAKEDMGCQFCDTNFRLSEALVMTFAEVADRMRQTFAGTALAFSPLVVITGGEPMMQRNLSRFISFLRHQAGWSQVQIESNGDTVLDDLPREPWLTLVVSPKAGKAGYRKLSPAVQVRADFYKFIVEAVPGSPYFALPDWEMTRPVFISPITQYLRPVPPGAPASAWDFRTVDTRQTQANYRHAVGIAMQYGYRLSHQSHLFFGVP